ncbi:MAG: hypothetical protein E7516_09420 [Ruminococcaceae bacterium]|nr:hypothetical protein [Oscillospiraceae bacterium]
MDFSKIKPAVEDITLSDEQKEKILDACRGKKRKFNYKPLAFAAAAAVTVVVIASPGFIFRAGSSNDAAENVKEDYYDIASGGFYLYTADGDFSPQSAEENGAAADIPVFKAEGFPEQYSVIPREFKALADSTEYENWVSGISPDGGMALMQFVKHFGVERSDFDNANIAYAARTGKFFNADEVYSFK